MSQKVDIDSVKNSVLSKFPLLGVPMSNLKFKEEKHVSTACTDGQTIYYSPDFMNSLSYEEKTFVVAHEVMHVAFDHIKRSKGKDMETWNIATDAVINQILKEQKLNGIKDMVDIEDALNKSAEEVYDTLYEEKQKLLQNLAQQMNQQQNQQQGKSGQQGSQGGQGNQQNSQNSQNGQGGQNGNQQDQQSGQGQQSGSQGQQNQGQQSGQGQQNSSQGGQSGQSQSQGQPNQNAGQQSGQGQNGNQTSQNQSQQNGQSQGQGSQGGQNSQNHSNQNGGQQSAGGNGGSSGGNTKGRLVLDENGNVQHNAHDHHDIWEKALKRMEKQEKKEEKRNKKNKDRDSNNKNPNENKQNAQDFEKEFSKQNQQSQGQQGNQQNKQQDSTQQMGQHNDSLGELFQDKDLNDKQNGRSEKGEETKPMPNSQEIEKAFAESIKQDQEGEEQKPEDRPEEVLSKEEIEKAFSQANKQKKEEMGKKIRERLASQAKQAGVGMGDRDGTFGEVGKQKAVVDWKKLLRRELEKEEDRWSYRRADAENGYSARIGSFEIDEKSVTEVMLDTSGSVSDVMLRNFLRQLKPLLKESRMFVGCFDHNFYGFTEIKSNRDIDTFRIRGGGGTSFNTAAQYFSGKKGVNKLVFTDGYDYFTLMDKKYKDIKWLVFGGNTDFRPSLGKVIQVDERKLMQNFEREMGM